MRLDHHRTAGRQRRCCITTGHRERQREVTCAEYGHRTQADLAQAQIAARRGAFRQREVDGGALPAAIAHHFGEQAQLVTGASALAFQACLRQPRFQHRAFDQDRAQIHDALCDGFQEARALFQSDGTIGVEGGAGQCAGALQFGVAAQTEGRFDFHVTRGIDRPHRTFLAQHCAAADNHFAGNLHINSLKC